MNSAPSPSTHAREYGDVAQTSESAVSPTSESAWPRSSHGLEVWKSTIQQTTLLLAVVLAGCGRNDIQVHQVAKETAPSESVALPAGQPGAPGMLVKPQWTVPKGWEEVPPGEMRVASFRVAGPDGKTADVSVIPLPGLAGSDLDNVNRWRGQVGAPPIKAEDLPTVGQAVEIGGQQGHLFEQAGQAPGSDEKGRILAAILRREGMAWFFKMSGEDSLVAQQKPVFIEFLKSFTFPSAATQAGLPPSHPPIDSTMMAQAGASASGDAAKPIWQVPAGWKEVSGGPFLVAKFVVTGSDNAQAAVNVSASAGDGGGLLPNVNRWRAQLGLAPVAQGELQAKSLELAGGKATLVEMAGTDSKTGQKASLVGAMVPRGGQTWFYKLMGDEQAVARERDAFTTFIQTTKYSDAP